MIEEHVLTDNYWKEKIAPKYEGETQNELHLKLFHEIKIIKSEAAAKVNKNARETSTITHPNEPTKTAQETHPATA